MNNECVHLGISCIEGTLRLIKVTISCGNKIMNVNNHKTNELTNICERITKSTLKNYCRIKGCRMGRSGKVSLWYVSLLINTRFRFLILE